MRRPLLVLLLVLGCGGARGCGAPSPATAPSGPVPAARRVSVGYGAPETTAAQAVAIQPAFVERARARGWEVLTANAEGDAAVQAAQVDYFLSRGVSAIVVVPVNSAGICAVVARARAAGVPFFTIDRGTVGCEVDLTVLADNRLAGRQAGEAMVRLLTRRHGRPVGAVLELQGDLLQDVARARGAGFGEVLAAYPGIRVERRETRWDPAVLAAQARDALADRGIDGVYLHSDALGVPVILPILRELGRLHGRGAPDHVFVVGVDGAPAALEAIRAGFVDESSSQPLPDFALAVDYVDRRLRGVPLVEGEVRQEGAPWSPARLRRAPGGWRLELATTAVTVENVDAGFLWGNRR